MKNMTKQYATYVLVPHLPFMRKVQLKELFLNKKHNKFSVNQKTEIRIIKEVLYCDSIVYYLLIYFFNGSFEIDKFNL